MGYKMTEDINGDIFELKADPAEKVSVQDKK
jgi:hypothetical protein